jgi:hypothetical protein
VGGHRTLCAAAHLAAADIITEIDQAPVPEARSTAEVRTRARSAGLEVPDRGGLRPEIWQAWHDANAPNRT